MVVQYTIFAHDLTSGLFDVMTEIHPMRHFTLPEIDLLCLITGFERIGAEEFMTGNVLSENSWGACVILKKIGHE